MNLTPSANFAPKKSELKVDLDTIEQLESLDIGGEWLMKQVMDMLGTDIDN